MLMSEQSFCDRKLFIVSLSASWNPHYYQSVWAFVLLHCRTLLIKVSTQTLIFSWNWLRLSILSTNSKTLKYHKQITSTLNKFSNIFQIYIILYSSILDWNEQVTTGLDSIYCKFFFVSTFGKSALLYYNAIKQQSSSNKNVYF